MHVDRGLIMDESIADFARVIMAQTDERQTRLLLGGLSLVLGHGSATELAAMTGITVQTISRGRKEFMEIKDEQPSKKIVSSTDQRIRAPGGGRKKAVEKDPTIVEDILCMLDGNTIGDPMSPLTWTTLSTTKISDALAKKGKNVSRTTVGEILKTEGFSLQQNKKYTESGNPGPDRDSQFKFISDQALLHQQFDFPVISIDAKKKELIGNYKNNGSEYRPIHDPRLVNDHDFMGPDGKATPYGVYDVFSNEGYVGVGISADTAQFAVNSIRSWWELMGSVRYPNAKTVMITADCGGSNGRRNKLWKKCLQELSDDTGLTFNVRHYPPGTSKWNKIEHRMFSYISMNWKGKPLESLELIVKLIGSTTTKEGLTIKCEADYSEYEKGIKVSDEEMDGLNITQCNWMPDWNYTISPRT